MNVRPANDADLAKVFASLSRYAEFYRKNVGNTQTADSFVDGRPQNIEDAGWLHYEGTSAWFPPGMLKGIMPWLVMNALVKNDDCRWIVLDGSVAIQHPLIEPPITYQSLNDGTWLDQHDYDEPPHEGEMALDSYGDLMALFSKKRIHGVSPFH